jgi:mannose-6-phosphate isomerase-like protein (cupin superfamily)
MKQKKSTMKMRVFNPVCNLNTIKDGRGGVFSFVPPAPIAEWTHQFIKAGKIRGNHYHPEFDEYYLFTAGHGVVVTKSDDGTKEEFLYVGAGDCISIPRGVSHVTYAITDIRYVTFLTKKWNDCKEPIVHENLGMGDHVNPDYPDKNSD